MILSSADEVSIHRLAEMADRIVDVATLTVTTVSTSPGDYDLQRLICKEVITALQAQERSRL